MLGGGGGAGSAATRGLDGCVGERPGKRALGVRHTLCLPRMTPNLQTRSVPHPVTQYLSPVYLSAVIHSVVSGSSPSQRRLCPT